MRDDESLLLAAGPPACSLSSITDSHYVYIETPKIPAGGSVWIYVGNFQAADAPLTFDFTVEVTAL